MESGKIYQQLAVPLFLIYPQYPSLLLVKVRYIALQQHYYSLGTEK